MLSKASYYYIPALVLLTIMQVSTANDSFASENASRDAATRAQAFHDVQNQVSRFFRDVDARNWQAVSEIFDQEVLVDYSSFTGMDAATLPRAEIIKGWSEFLPQFDATHHQIGTIAIQIDGKEAHVQCHGTATHYKKSAPGGETQQVIGDYEIGLVHKGEAWRIRALTFNFVVLTGNPDLPGL